ncbi:hypothetical protein K488DRAFT_43143 [Vararia minispora EC-137]|uniref:Uncharacterized protein n=1 Tax=Vararia minispora EC-137 TaxID=1314806 RepID=A0ACB8QVE8_9AGAM|nr:hypothetical protein K488DRAFT_43143 [Vararia minispora EC-137]
MNTPGSVNPGQPLLTNIRNILTHSAEKIVQCFTGASQYSTEGTGTASCGLAALNFARLVFDRDQKRPPLDDPLVFLNDVLSRETIEEATSICMAWNSNIHMEVDEIAKIPLFDKSLKLFSRKYGRPGLDEFKTLLSELVLVDGSAVVVITRPPEIVACTKLKLSKSTHMFIIFDSHPRQRYPDGTGIIVTASIEVAAQELAELLPVISLAKSGLEWQAQLLSNYSGHIFVPQKIEDRRTYLTDVALESSLALLACQSKMATLISQNATLERENRLLEEHMETLQNEVALQRSYALQHLQSTSTNTSHTNSRLPDASLLTSQISIKTSKHAESKDSRNHNSDSRSSTVGLNSDTDGYRFALRQQQLYDTEDTMLRDQLHDLNRNPQQTFDCQICLDSYPEDVVLRVDYCRHEFCRHCMKEYIASKLQEHRFPIFCPICTTTDAKQRVAITQGLVMCTDLGEEQQSLWTEMQMATLSVQLHCRKCCNTVWVDKNDFNETRIVVCPLPGCGHVWCRDCQQVIETDSGPQHSCDGSSELDYLMQTEGWKYCPHCRTPIQRAAGCYHMTASCITPGCNTHFCYRCGESIVQSALQREINEATSDHYRRCQLFEVPP